MKQSLPLAMEGNTGFPFAGDGMVILKGQPPTRSWPGSRWKQRFQASHIVTPTRRRNSGGASGEHIKSGCPKCFRSYIRECIYRIRNGRGFQLPYEFANQPEKLNLI